MKQIKIIKLVESKLLLPNSKAISADVGAGILVPKHFVFSGKICNYFIMAPQQNEKHKYDSLWTDIEDGKLKSAFEKRVLPIGYPTEAIFAEELLNAYSGAK